MAGRDESVVLGLAIRDTGRSAKILEVLARLRETRILDGLRSVGACD